MLLKEALFTVLTISTAATVFTSNSIQDDTPARVTSQHWRERKNCISTPEDLWAAFQKGEGHMPLQHPLDKMRFTLFITKYRHKYGYIYLLYNTANTTDTIQSNTIEPYNNKCCNPNEFPEECYGLMVTREISTTDIVPLYLQNSFVNPLLSFTPTGTAAKMTSAIRSFVGCWTPPPFCGNISRYDMLQGFTYTLLASNGRYSEVPQVNRIKQRPERYVVPTLVYGMVINMCLVMLPVALICIKHSHRQYLDCQRSAAGRAMLLSGMVTTWLIFTMLIAAHYNILNWKYQVYLSKLPDAVSGNFKPFLTIGNYVLLILGVIFLLEFPFVLWYIAKRLSSVQPIAKRMGHSLGFTGLVYLMQILGGHLVYAFLALVTAPFVFLGGVITMTAFFILLTATLSLPILLCVNNCQRRCWTQYAVIGFCIQLSLIASGFTVLLYYITADNYNIPLNTQGIISSLLSSAVLAVMGYLVKLTLFRGVENEHDDDEEMLQVHNE